MIVVQAQLAGRTRPLSCSTGLMDLEIGERVILQWPSRGREELARVTRIPLEVPWKEGVPLPRVLRRAEQRDEEQASHSQRRIEQWLRRAQENADELGLEMRFIRAESNPSGRKVTLLFVAEGRVDFRTLVRELAREFRARVELHQVGVRDAATTQGGVGHCGRELCCSTWLPGFAPVSMKMAKAQGLPLNPAKISGQCGRLMCCLRYEFRGNSSKGGSKPRGRQGSGGQGQGPRPDACQGCTPPSSSSVANPEGGADDQS